MQNTYFNRSNLDVIEELYQQFQKDPESVDIQWKYFFDGLELGQSLKTPPVNTKPPAASPQPAAPKLAATNGSAVPQTQATPGELTQKDLGVIRLIQAYRDNGHFQAHLNPIAPEPPKEIITLEQFGLSDQDLESEFKTDDHFEQPVMKLKDIIAHLKSCYCDTFSVQVASALPEIRRWFHTEVEKEKQNYRLSAEHKMEIIKQLTNAEALEKFLHTRFVGAKRFSIEGADAMIPMLDTLVHEATPLGVREIVIGMAHRGRINVLTNLMGQGLDVVFAKFQGQVDEESPIAGGGDVKYHLGFSADKETPGGKCHLSLAFNPSHLEAVNPVVLGMTRAKQRVYQDTEKRKVVLPVLIHGDAAFAGQGVVAETLQQSLLRGFRVGGTIHIIVDNQVGFTTNPSEGRSSPYASDMAKSLLTPVIHCNGDDPEACVKAMEMALRFRQDFGRDVVINLMCYRRFGHNEGDEPAFTQPLMYKIIPKHPTPRAIYGEKNVKENFISKEDFDKMYNDRINTLQDVLAQVREKPPVIKTNTLGGIWTGLRTSTPDDFTKATDTKIDKATLEDVGKIINSFPETFTPHPKLKKLIDRRIKMINGEEHLDWGMAELLAYGSLLREGTPVRLSGQDVLRGTFTHRHAVYFDFMTGESYWPLKQVSPQKTDFSAYNSLLSEMAVLGFEYGNSIGDPRYLTLWEAQFGDFANSAQVIIDQFISSGETKWLRMSGLVMLLPHGYEGQGPEHSSARLERYLQLCAQDNMQVCNLTTPGQLFHVFRRQVKRDFRKPLIIMSPKSLLRHPKCVSTMDELATGTFQEVIADPNVKDPSKVKKAIFCTGKVYYDIEQERSSRGDEATSHLAICRLEQVFPRPDVQIKKLLETYPNLEKIEWCQEEPKNMGSYFFVQPWLKKISEDLGLKSTEIEYHGREDRASPATGSPHVHSNEQKQLVNSCFDN